MTHTQKRRSNAKRARRWYETDSKIAVFRAEFGRNHIDPDFCAVNLYPRKSRRGFIYCIWKHGVSEIGLSAIVDGGICRAKSFEGAAPEATKALLEHVKAESLTND